MISLPRLDQDQESCQKSIEVKLEVMAKSASLVFRRSVLRSFRKGLLASFPSAQVGDLMFIDQAWGQSVLRHFHECHSGQRYKSQKGLRMSYYPSLIEIKAFTRFLQVSEPRSPHAEVRPCQDDLGYVMFCSIFF